jgi:RHS repeat-associated protein
VIDGEAATSHQNPGHKTERAGIRAAGDSRQAGGPGIRITLGAPGSAIAWPNLGFTYDGMGNVTNDGSYSYSYDAEGRPITINGASAIYDAFGRTVELNNGSKQILYGPSGNKFAYMSGQTVQKYYLPLAAGVQDVYDGSGIRYIRYVDWQGSSRVQLTWDGAVVGGEAYAPYGETYAETGTADRMYTGQTQDAIAGSTGMYDFLFRQYSPSQSRWIVPDPAGLAAVDLTNPQTWNRYAYVGNNPLSNTDALGLIIQWPPPPPPPGWFDYLGSLGGGGNGNPLRLQLQPLDGPGEGRGGFLGNVSKFQLKPPSTTGTKAPSSSLLNFLASCEGFSGTAYPDANGNCTIGYGHLLHLGQCTVADGALSVTRPGAMSQFTADVQTAVTTLNNNLSVPLNQGQFDAMVSLTFNMGMGRLQTHDVWKDVNAGNMAAVPGDIRTLGAGGGGMPTRRANEANIFQNGVYADACYSTE